MEDIVEPGVVTRRWPLLALAIVLVLALAGGAVALNVGGSYDHLTRSLGIAQNRDTDGDGLYDHAESAGWRTVDLGVFKTDPNDADSDDDGLTDGQEAGEAASGQGDQTIYAGIANPNRPDTDEDQVGDGDEYFLDMNPRLADTDDDGLRDDLELEFESDPTAANADEDSYSDKEEYDRESDPMAFDLTSGEAGSAFLVGATAGSWEWAARRAGMNEAQLESPEYLAGQIASGLVGIGDIRDLVADLGTLNVVGALVSVVALAPGPGDAAKAVHLATEFAKRGYRAERAAAWLIEHLPLPGSTKAKAIAKIQGGTFRLPYGLRGGKKNYTVYKNGPKNPEGYVGITNDLARRQIEHARNGRGFVPQRIEGAEDLSRGEARAIEEFCIIDRGLDSLANKRHSISPLKPHYDEAVAWGRHWIAEHEASCA